MTWPVERYGGPQIDLLVARNELGSRGTVCASRTVDWAAVPPPLPRLPLAALRRCRFARWGRLRRQPPSPSRWMARVDLSRTRQVGPCLESRRSWRVCRPPRCSVGRRDELETVEHVLESTYLFAVCLHFRVVAVRGLHHLVDDKLGVASDVEASDS